MTNPQIESRRFGLIACVLVFLTCTFGCEVKNLGSPIAVVDGPVPEHGMLGVRFSAPPNELLLSEVFAGGPAYVSGIRIGDTVIAIDNQAIQSVDEALSVIRSTQPGDQVIVRVRRSSQEQDFKVTACDFKTIVALQSMIDNTKNPRPHIDSNENNED